MADELFRIIDEKARERLNLVSETGAARDDHKRKSNRLVLARNETTVFDKIIVSVLYLNNKNKRC